MYLVITILAILIFSAVSSAMIVSYPHWKYYPKLYILLNKDDWYHPVEDQWWNIYDKDATYFEDDNSICLTKGIYLHNNFVTFLDPYSRYWYFKYKSWFKKNLTKEKDLFVDKPLAFYTDNLPK